MSRSGYCDDLDNWSLICWRGAVNSAIKGRRGQAFLIELRDALDAMPDKRLIAEELEADGQYCALGVLGAKRGIDMKDIDPDCRESVAAAFGIAPAMAAEIVFENDEYPGGFYGSNGEWSRETPEHRWQRMRNWVEENIHAVTP
ncbi:hypothetical protein A9C11_10825 [Pseudomonas citronellolis]|uniref:Uncharacterized protein n=1 Tax=Pseudomonas citronellolis TaxID=53408 RepID=A0A1A9KA54_9PSED|nr:hypothetical protein [Pseudomonas citronellolis]ANI14445.1 hypothetical protein A9C11_10825 [Pseudomonas citronellolis]